MDLDYWFEPVYKFLICYIQILQFNVIAIFLITLKIYTL